MVGLVQHVQGSTRIPVLGHADGICSVFVDEDADLEKAISVVVDSKTNYPAACNSTETLIIHSKSVERILPSLSAKLMENQVKLLADPQSISFIPKNAELVASSGSYLSFLKL